MKKLQQYCTVLLISASFFLQTSPIYSQAPAGMNYQAVVRDAAGDILANRNVSLRLSITNGQSGTILYQERHEVMSNQFGLVTLTIGMGTQASGDFDEILWEFVVPWLRVEMDPNGGNAYVNMGSSQLMSVPYALFAERGNQGPPGEDGLQGPPGEDGVQGPQGPQGPPGSGLSNGSAPGNTPYWNGTSWIVNSSNIYNNGGNIGINTNAPDGKLHINGSEDVSQLIIDANSAQTSPLITLRSSSGADLMWIHSDDQHNSFVGIGAGASINGGSNNTAIGVDALTNNTTGLNNVAVGNFALYDNTVGNDNTATGYSALNANTTGHDNTAIGDYALISNTTGNWNTAVGNRALSSNTTGVNNTSLGNQSSQSPNFDNTTALGASVSCSASNQVRIGNSSVTSIGGHAPWTDVSDERFKRNISENVVGLDFIKALRPVTYNMDLHAIDDWWAENYDERDSSLAILGYEKEKIVYSGFIAQEVEETARALGYDFSGVDAPKNDKDFYGLRYGTFVVPLVKAVQEQQVQIEELRRENAELRTSNDQRWTELQLQINALQSAVDEFQTGIRNKATLVNE